MLYLCTCYICGCSLGRGYAYTVGSSCAKLDYGTAQRMLDGEITVAAATAVDDAHRAFLMGASFAESAEAVAGEARVGAIVDGESEGMRSWAQNRRPYPLTGASRCSDFVVHSCASIVKDVNILWSLARVRRESRFRNGALSLNKVCTYAC